MSAGSRQVTMKDLVEEAKKRIVFLVICVIGLSYLMSLTSSSVLVNLPAAASLIIILRYFSLDFEMRKKAVTYNSKQPVSNASSQKKSLVSPKEIKERSNWRRKVDSPVVEDAIEHFTRHLVSEWVTDLWYSRLTPDKEGPEELVHIINDVIAELSNRARNVNLIDLLMRDLVSLICTHLEIFRMTQAKIPKKQSDPLDIQYLDAEFKRILANENRLHPALFSAEAEHKVLQHIMDGFISFAFKAEDLQCNFFRYLVRELLACAVMRPVVNLANPRFINERIEAVVIARTRNKVTVSVEEASLTKNMPARLPPDHFSRSSDPSVTGVELVQLKTNPSKAASGAPVTNNAKGMLLSKDPLLCMEAQSSRTWNSLPSSTQNGNEKGIQQQRSGGEWGEMLDVISRRKAQALAPEHFENMWAKGRNYRKKVGEDHATDQIPPSSSERKSVGADKSSMLPKPEQKNVVGKNNIIGGSTHGLEHKKTSCIENCSIPEDQKLSSQLLGLGTQENDELNVMHLEEADSGYSSYTSEDDENDTATGLDSPGTKVWDGRSKRNQSVPAIHHPLETFEGRTARKTSERRIRSQGYPSNQSGRKRGRLSSRKVHVWQEVERTSFLSGDGQDILGNLKDYESDEASSDDFEDELLVRANSGATASSSAPSVSTLKSSVNSLQSAPVMDSFLKLRCEVLGANIVKSGSRAFAVYSISVADINNNSWTIKRRFRHFEELHRRLKEFPEYNLHLPPKHFLSTGLDVSVIRERCTLLDKYLKKLMQLPTVSGSIEVWDFLSVDSQTYYFSNSFSIIETLSVDLGSKPSEKDRRTSSSFAPEISSSWPEISVPKKKETSSHTQDVPVDGLRVTPKGKKMVNNNGNVGTEETSGAALDASSDPTLPMEWIPPNLSVPLLDLVDVIFQLQDGGWIRRKAFWVAKQVLQLGMGDAFDDWLIEKIQLLRKGSVVASGIKRVEQILWPDGIFITKRLKRQQSSPPANLSQGSPRTFHPTEPCSPKLPDEQQKEAERRAKFVYELMIDNAPAAIVGLVGRREYEQCATDLYLFLQSSVCLKLLAYDLLELLLLSAFPELDHTFRQLFEEKDKFGEYKAN